VHRVATPRRLGARAANERGAIAIMFVLTMTALILAAAMVVDLGLVKVDRQVNKSAADSATTAGLYGLNGGNGEPYAFQGVCRAIRYLQQNDRRFANVDSGGLWYTGDGSLAADGCTDPSLLSTVCVPTDRSTWARYEWSDDWQGAPLSVTIESGYSLTENTSWTEEGLPAVSADVEDGAEGCNQLAVTISQSRSPGLGILATEEDLESAIRTVGRVKQGPGGYAPAMILLKRSGCPVLQTGGSGGDSFIRVYGASSSNGVTQPGSIHSDADGSSCTGGSNKSIFLGRATDGIVAFAAPSATDPDVADPSKPGQITSVAGTVGIDGDSTVVRDTVTYVYGSGALKEDGAAAAEKVKPMGRSLVTRKPVDDRYLPAVDTAVTGAQSLFSTLDAGNAVAQGYAVVSDCNPATLPPGEKLFIDCTGTYKGTKPINAKTVVFRGNVNSTSISMPKATKVYIFGVSKQPAITLSTGKTFSMHTEGNLVSTPDGPQCSTSVSNDSTNKAVLFVRDGVIKQSGTSLLQLCRTTVIMMGGHPRACLPPVGYATAPPPNPKPCVPVSGLPVEGTGQLDQTGGTVDWTAPNNVDVTTDDEGEPTPEALAAWGDPNGPEDLAFWSESGVSSSDTYSMAGGGGMHAVGVYMVPNADPFIISGGAGQTLTNAQYIATSIELNGNKTAISMKVDPSSAVTLPKLHLVGLVR
jgi:hypothetical protein